MLNFRPNGTNSITKPLNYHSTWRGPINRTIDLSGKPFKNKAWPAISNRISTEPEISMRAPSTTCKEKHKTCKEKYQNKTTCWDVKMMNLINYPSTTRISKDSSSCSRKDTKISSKQPPKKCQNKSTKNICDMIRLSLNWQIRTPNSEIAVNIWPMSSTIKLLRSIIYHLYILKTKISRDK